MSAKKTASAEELDRMFDAGEDMTDYFDWSKARRPGLEAKRRGVTRQALIKMWLAEKLDRAA